MVSIERKDEKGIKSFIERDLNKDLKSIKDNFDVQ